MDIGDRTFMLLVSFFFAFSWGAYLLLAPMTFGARNDSSLPLLWFAVPNIGVGSRHRYIRFHCESLEKRRVKSKAIQDEAHHGG